MTSRSQYALVTPVRNEADFIGRTIDSVVAQTCPPIRWVIVSDGSTDNTDEIIRGREATLPFLRFVRRDANDQRDFRSKVMAIRLGMSHLVGVDYAYVGNLDGDVSLAPNYFERLLACFEASTQLGIAGGLICEDSLHSSRAQFVQTDTSVAGAVQMFRRACYEQIGGYPALPLGGEDAAVELMARMHGWQTRTIRDLHVLHHRTTGTHGRGALQSFYDIGRREAVLGYHPLFEVFRVLNRMLASPLFLGGLVQFLGYMASKLRGEPIALDPPLVAFLRAEQLRRLRMFAQLERDT